MIPYKTTERQYKEVEVTKYKSALQTCLSFCNRYHK